jgi:salicylate hydroxylase
LTAASVAIIGGGIGGFTCAMAFASKGAKVFLFEQAPMFTEVGAGLQITPNGARVLRNLGLDRQMDHHGIMAKAVVPTDALTGTPIARFVLSQKSPPSRFIQRAALIDGLGAGALELGVTVVLGARVTAATQNGHVSYSLAEGELAGVEQTFEADLVVFADGLHSVGRPLMNPASEPFFTGQVAWRAVVAMDAPAEARIWMAPGGHVVTYPLPDGRLNVVAVQERDAWAAEGWAHADDPVNLQAAFSGCAPQLRAILAKVEQASLWGLFRHEVAEHWHSGRLAILGDAAHPTLPFLAQGANMAIEDAYILAECCGDGASFQEGLARYQALRRPRVVRAIAAANSNARNYHLAGARRRVAHLGLRALGKVAPDAFVRRLDWLYEYDVSQTD